MRSTPLKTKTADRIASGLPRRYSKLPYINGDYRPSPKAMVFTMRSIRIVIFEGPNVRSAKTSSDFQVNVQHLQQRRSGIVIGIKRSADRIV